MNDGLGPEKRPKMAHRAKDVRIRLCKGVRINNDNPHLNQEAACQESCRRRNTAAQPHSLLGGALQHGTGSCEIIEAALALHHQKSYRRFAGDR